MRLKALIVALSAAAAVPAFAQAVGTVTNVTGVATVTTGSSGAAIVSGAPIVNGARVITTSTGTVTLRMNNGCTVTVPGGHAVTVQSNLTCEQLQARIQPVTTTVTTATTTSTVPVGMGFSAPPAAVGVFALGALLFIADSERDNDRPISGR